VMNLMFNGLSVVVSQSVWEGIFTGNDVTSPRFNPQVRAFTPKHDTRNIRKVGLFVVFIAFCIIKSLIIPNDRIQVVA
jgi:hypothetical protein